MARFTDTVWSCDNVLCTRPATVTQPKYRGNSDDRHGPLVLYRCDTHRDPNLPADPIEPPKGS